MNLFLYYFCCQSSRTNFTIWKENVFIVKQKLQKNTAKPGKSSVYQNHTEWGKTGRNRRSEQREGENKKEIPQKWTNKPSKLKVKKDSKDGNWKRERD